ncbi:hypothetical protein BpHYR1_028651 [Brachionus plicatilis]|uniref:BHLH domain-containing protein n=1 Tax=Brachionus plicatilis TaxID=10195 RepID=A0A3M7RWU6_BRAPC|nr:hypothetical protein BpHYR1_028651 [Brachionus plicatilis]
MNFSLNRLCSLIPENFRNQVNQGNTRVDKIKIVDIAILYVEHLHELIGQYTQTDQARKHPNDVRESPKDAQTSTCDLIPVSIAHDTDLSYIKGFFNGTLEYLSYLIEQSVLSQPGKPGQVAQTQSIELYVDTLRKFHAIYFHKIQLSPESIKCVIESNVVSEDAEDKCAHRPLSFPFNNAKLIKKILHILSLYSDQKQTNLIKYYKKVYECVLHANGQPRGEPAQNSSPLSDSSGSSRSCSISTCSSEKSTDSDSSESESCRKKSKNAESVPMTSSKVAEAQPPVKQPARKLKSNLIERFSSTNTEDTPAQSKQTSEDQDQMVSIFILHSSHDFYLSGCLDKSLLDASLLKNVITNVEFKPRSVQKIKLDVVFGADIVIKRDHGVPTFSQYASLFSNKRKSRQSGALVHPSLRKFAYNLSDENRILESYLRAIRKAHENKKKQTNGYKYDNLTIMYKNYSRGANIDDQDQMSEKTFYTV